MYPGSSSIMELMVTVNDGNREALDIKLEGLPSEVTGYFTTEIKTPTSICLLKLTASPKTTEGIYPVKIIATSKQGEINEYSFKLTISSSYDGFGISGVDDLTIKAGNTQALFLIVKFKPEVNETINLRVDGELPYNISTAFTKLNGSSDFYSTLLIKAQAGAVPNTYPLALIATSNKGIEEVHPFYLTISKSSSSLLIGSWRLVGEGSDVNSDNIYQTGEAATSSKQNFVSFYHNDTGEWSSREMSWQVEDTTLVIIYNTNNSYYRLASIDSTEMVLGHFTDQWMWDRYARRIF